MATFKVGQRVKRLPIEVSEVPTGSEGVVTEILFETYYQYRVHYPALGRDWPTASYVIAPLTDPLADAFIERIKKLKPYDEPVVEHITDEMRRVGHESHELVKKWLKDRA